MKCPKCQEELYVRTFGFKNSNQTADVHECLVGHGTWVGDEFFKKLDDDSLMANLRGQHYADEASAMIRD